MTSTTSTPVRSVRTDEEYVPRGPGPSVGRPTSRTPTSGRPRALPGDEAYLRSELAQAAIDIAAGR